MAPSPSNLEVILVTLDAMSPVSSELCFIKRYLIEKAVMKSIISGIYSLRIGSNRCRQSANQSALSEGGGKCRSIQKEVVLTRTEPTRRTAIKRWAMTQQEYALLNATSDTSGSFHVYSTLSCWA